MRRKWPTFDNLTDIFCFQVIKIFSEMPNILQNFLKFEKKVPSSSDRNCLYFFLIILRKIIVRSFLKVLRTQLNNKITPSCLFSYRQHHASRCFISKQGNQASGGHYQLGHQSHPHPFAFIFQQTPSCFAMLFIQLGKLDYRGQYPLRLPISPQSQILQL